MPKPRKRLVSLADTPYYHCIARCVRRAFLCGKDPLTGFDFEHRRQWIVDRLKLLSEIFAIDICAYAVMSNHYHLVLRIDARQAKSWSDQDVAERWTRLFIGPMLVRRWLAGDNLGTAEQDVVADLIIEWRSRLMDLSWFMRCLNESIARMANREDRCTGRFWEGRFKSQALLDERAVLACMAYVDLNPIRAAIAKKPEESDFTSIQQRIRDPQDISLRPFAGHDDDDQGIPFNFIDYLEFVDWAGRAIHPHKKGYIPESTPPILERLNMEPEVVLNYLRKPRARLTALGPVSRMRLLAHSVGLRFIRGINFSKSLCPEAG